MMAFKTVIRPRIIAIIMYFALAGLISSAAADGATLQLRRISPSGADVAPGQEIVLQFDRPMVKLGNMARKASEIPVQITPALACQWRWLDISELACRLSGQAKFRPATHYHIKVGTHFRALDGSHLAQPVIQTFTTERPRVAWTHFQKWRSPVKPAYLVRFNLPVTPNSVKQSIYFASKTNGTVPANVETYNRKRTGPLWLPVPDAPGALVQIDKPEPKQALDADKVLGGARRQWLVIPDTPLASATSYTLELRAGLATPLGELGGKREKLTGATQMQTYGPFKFAGITCNTENSNTSIAPFESPAARCRPGDISLRFTAPVPRATLKAAQWDPLPLPKTILAAHWKNYPSGYLGLADSPTDAASPDKFPLMFDLAPMHRYSITIPAGVKDSFGRTLQNPATVAVRTGHRAPFFDPPPTQAVLEAGEPTVAPLRFTNLTRLDFTYRRLFAAEFSHLDTATSKTRTDNILQRPNLNAEQDKIVTAPLGVRQALKGRSGVVWGHLDWAPIKHHYLAPRTLFGEVTPYEVFAKVGHFNTLVWVKSFRSGKPVANATVRFLSARPQALQHLSALQKKPVTTNAHGLAVLPGAIDLPATWFTPWKSDAPHFYVNVVKGGAIALLPLDYTFRRSIAAASDYALFSDNQPTYGHMHAWALTEQGIYRPGSEVRFAVFARNVGNAKLAPPPDLKYTLKVSDSGGNVVLEKKHISLSTFGGIHTSLHIAKTAPTGWYSITLSWPQSDGTASRQAGRFLVTDFVPASFKVSTMIKGKRFGPGAAVHDETEAKLHAGGPYTDAKTKVTAKILSLRFAPDTPVTSGFEFSANPDDAPNSITVFQTQGQLNHSGQATTSFTLPAKSKIHYGSVDLETAVESARGTWIAARASAEYVARDRFIGLRTKHWLLESGKPATVRYLVVNADGKPRAGSTVHLLLQHKKVSSVRVKNAAGYFTTEQHTKWVSEDQCRAVSTTRPASCELTPKHAGSYRIEARVQDTHGRRQTASLDTWATGAGAVTWGQEKGVRLVPDKSEYHVGDTAHVLVQNPFPGARALVSVERYGVQWHKTVRLSGSAPMIDVPIKKTFFPGTYLSVTIFSPRVSKPGPPDLGKPEVALGYVALKVSGKGSSLNVEVTPDAPVHKPRQRVHVNVKVHTQQGDVPRKTRLVAVAVDQAVVDLLAKGAHYYDPRTAFYAPPDDPDVSNYSLAQQLLTRLKPKAGKGENPGGGGGKTVNQGPNVRSIFKYAAYWNAGLTTNQQGQAQFSFKLPDNLTRWRIFVIALTPGSAMGIGATSVRVNLPIQVQPALPNQVHAGDNFGAGFSVTNRTGKKHSIETRIQAQGPISGHTASAKTTLNLGSYAHALAWLHLQALQPGTIDLTGTARAGKLGDALNTHIPVRRAESAIVAAQYGSTTGKGAHVPIKVPNNALTGATRLKVTLAPTLIGSLEAAFATLRDDPLQTWETRLSRGVLGADYLRLKPVLGKSVRWPTAAGQIKAMLNAAADFQAPNGGMAFWIPRNDFVSPYLSVYTALAFNWLADMGHRVPATVQDHLRTYLHTTILAGGAQAGSAKAAAAPILKAGALAALAPTETLAEGAVAGMLVQLPQLDLFGKALLLHAALDVHDQTSARTIVKSILSSAEESAGSISFNENEPGVYLNILATPLRSNCAVLDALVAYKNKAENNNLIGTTPEKLMRWVNAQKRNAGGWPNSQENVFCTTAIAHYAQAYEHPVKKLTGTVSVAGDHIGQARFSSRRAPAKSMAKAPPNAAKSFNVKLARSGKGRLYYNVRLRYALPPDAVKAADAGFTVHRKYSRQHGETWRPVGAKTVLKRGDIVRVDLTVDAPTERHHVVLTDPLPGGLEAVNRQLATSQKSLPAKLPNSTVLMFDYGAWPNASVTTGGFYHRETAFDAVRFYADDLPAGHYHIIYAAQVISPGRFIAPAPQVKEIYQPDVFGRGQARHIKVVLPGK